jgi:hypothetical protein
MFRSRRAGFRALHVLPASLISLAAASPLAAQRATYTNFNSWYALGADIALSERWAVLIDLQDRRSGPIDETQAVFFRPALTYEISPNVKLGYGVSRSESYPYGKIPNAYAAPEWRTFEQIVISHNTGRVAFAHRYRLEQRWQGKRGADTSDHDIKNYVRSSRVRYQVKAVLPLRGETVDVGEAYLTGYDEVMIGFGANVQNNIFDQNRATIGLGWRFAKAWRAELAFLEQLILKPNGSDFERDHTVTLGLYYLRPPKRGSRE